MARKMGLGKGLEALIPGNEPEPIETGAMTLPVDQILPNPQQPRSSMPLEGLEDLAASIKEHGILQPLIVSKDAASDKYFLVAGERRLRAAHMAGLEFVPVIIRQVTHQEQLELALIENIQRADLNPLETAEAYHKLSEEFGLSHEAISQRVGKSRVSVTNTLRLLKLPEVIRTALSEAKLSEGHARALLSLSRPEEQVAVFHLILEKNLNVRQTELLVQDLLQKSHPVKKASGGSQSPEAASLEERLRGHFGTRVDLHQGKNGGKLIIHFYSDEELNSIMNQILGE